MDRQRARTTMYVEHIVPPQEKGVFWRVLGAVTLGAFLGLCASMPYDRLLGMSTPLCSFVQSLVATAAFTGLVFDWPVDKTVCGALLHCRAGSTRSAHAGSPCAEDPVEDPPLPSQVHDLCVCFERT